MVNFEAIEIEQLGEKIQNFLIINIQVSSLFLKVFIFKRLRQKQMMNNFNLK